MTVEELERELAEWKQQYDCQQKRACDAEAELAECRKERDDLLAVCEAFVDVTAPLSRRTAGSDDKWEDTIRMARNEIAKAKGK